MNTFDILNQFQRTTETTHWDTVAINATILIVLAIGLPAILIGIVALFKIKISRRNSMYLYAFASGLMILLGTVGLIGEGVEWLRDYFQNQDATSQTNDTINTVIIASILICGALFGIGIVFLTRFLVLKKERLQKKINNDELKFNQLSKEKEFENCIDDVCQHSSAIYNYRDIQEREMRLKRSNKSIAVILMVSHRLIDGISLGIFAPIGNLEYIASFATWGIIIVFIIHLIPSSLIIYLTQLDIYQSRLKAYLYSLMLLLIFIPFVYVGAFLSYGVGLKNQYTYWIVPFLSTTSGTILLLMSILELIPEFIDNRNMSKKQWTITILCLMSGIVLSIALLAIHSHSETTETINNNYVNILRN